MAQRPARTSVCGRSPARDARRHRSKARLTLPRPQAGRYNPGTFCAVRGWVDRGRAFAEVDS
jgi:hypothetical protein